MNSLMFQMFYKFWGLIRMGIKPCVLVRQKWVINFNSCGCWYALCVVCLYERGTVEIGVGGRRGYGSNVGVVLAVGDGRLLDYGC